MGKVMMRARWNPLGCNNVSSPGGFAMQGLEIEAVYEQGVLKLPRELPLVDGVTVRITIHPPGRGGAVKHVQIPTRGHHEELERWLNDPDESSHGDHDF
jgi:predicted DNA-binding antitoxin AbrB/MazE fold protein